MTEVTETYVPVGTEFERQKTTYFTSVAKHQFEALKLHQSEGLWERDESGKRDWGNVTEHCLVETARTLEFAELLGLPQDVTEDLTTAAALHDYFKKSEKAIVTDGGLSWESFDKANIASEAKLKAAGFNDRVIWLTGSIGHSSLAETEELVKKDKLTDAEKAYLILHYVDDYTVFSDWAEPAHIEGGRVVNSLDARVDMNEANARYKVIDEEGRARLGGKTTFETQRQVGHAVENRLAQMISDLAVIPVDPKSLPVLIDSLIVERISSLELPKA